MCAAVSAQHLNGKIDTDRLEAVLDSAAETVSGISASHIANLYGFKANLNVVRYHTDASFDAILWDIDFVQLSRAKIIKIIVKDICYLISLNGPIHVRGVHTYFNIVQYAIKHESVLVIMFFFHIDTFPIRQFGNPYLSSIQVSSQSAGKRISRKKTGTSIYLTSRLNSNA
ncbi:MAG: hypothetical protein EZS28_025994 [Streblomastix strix]|uniref:Uncharacterized protein n=1 Tax=Streblomastix strix TaxID=222440 RepID=A0A5J4V829_9EUKA|nr:MAG: hypothetical protein EZS28_025994 [Streblomastix strix]